MVHMHSPLHLINMYLLHGIAVPSCSLIFSHLMSSIPQTPTHFLRRRICAASFLLLSCFVKTHLTSILQRPVLILLYVISQQFSLSLLGRGHALIRVEIQNNFTTCMKSLKSRSLPYRVVQ